MANVTAIHFTVAAGKLEDWEGRTEVNWKYAADFTDAVEALAEFNKNRGYPVSEMHALTSWDEGTVTRASVVSSGPTEKLIAGQWVAIDEGGLTASERAAYAEQQRKH